MYVKSIGCVMAKTVVVVGMSANRSAKVCIRSLRWREYEPFAFEPFTFDNDWNH